jgi:hypothetical protein
MQEFSEASACPAGMGDRVGGSTRKSCKMRMVSLSLPGAAGAAADSGGPQAVENGSQLSAGGAEPDEVSSNCSTGCKRPDRKFKEENQMLKLTGAATQVNVTPTNVVFEGLDEGVAFYDSSSDFFATTGQTEVFARPISAATGLPTGNEAALVLPAPPTGQQYLGGTLGLLQPQALSDGSYLVLTYTGLAPTTLAPEGTPEAWALLHYSSSGTYLGALNSGSVAGLNMLGAVSVQARPDGNYDLFTNAVGTSGGVATLTPTRTTYTPGGVAVNTVTLPSLTYNPATQFDSVYVSEAFSSLWTSPAVGVDVLTGPVPGTLGASSEVDSVIVPWSSTAITYQPAGSNTFDYYAGGSFEADGSLVYGIESESSSISGSTPVTTVSLDVYHAVDNGGSTTTTSLMTLSVQYTTSPIIYGKVSVLGNGDIDVQGYSATTTTGGSISSYSYFSLVYSSSGEYLGRVNGLVSTTSGGVLTEGYAQNGNLYTQPLQYVSNAVPDDFYGSGVSGLTWQNQSSGATYEWAFSNDQNSGSVYLGSLPGWSVIGAGDFFGTGTNDVLWQSAQSGAVYDWTMSNGQHVGDAFLGNLSGWTPTVGDFNGDGTSDLVWQNNSSGAAYEWIMSNGQDSQNVFLGNLPGWTPTAGDFTGNGTSDLIWQNTSSGATYEWMISAGQHVAGSDVFLGNLPGWSIIGKGDFTGNGTDDVVWQNAASGATYEWLMSNGQHTGDVFLGNLPGWNLVGTGDYSGGGTDGMIWQNAASGATYEWTMSNGQHVAGSDVFLGNLSGWSAK